MSHDGRARRASVSDAAGEELSAQRSGECAAGTFPERAVGRKIIKPIARAEIAGLKRLVDAGRMIRRSDGSYGTSRKKLITNAIARQLKARRLAISGFQGEMVISAKGRRVIAESTP